MINISNMSKIIRSKCVINSSVSWAVIAKYANIRALAHAIYAKRYVK